MTLVFFIKKIALNLYAVEHTENDGIQAFIRQVLINQHIFISLNAATKKSNKFISKFLASLVWVPTKSFDCNLLTTF